MCLCHQLPLLTGVSIFCPTVALFAPTQGCLQLPLWLCQGWIVLSWKAAQLWQVLLGSLPACWDCPCPAWVVVPAAA